MKILGVSDRSRTCKIGQKGYGLYFFNKLSKSLTARIGIRQRDVQSETLAGTQGQDRWKEFRGAELPNQSSG